VCTLKREMSRIGNVFHRETQKTEARRGVRVHRKRGRKNPSLRRVGLNQGGGKKDSRGSSGKKVVLSSSFGIQWDGGGAKKRVGRGESLIGIDQGRRQNPDRFIDAEIRVLEGRLGEKGGFGGQLLQTS